MKVEIIKLDDMDSIYTTPDKPEVYIGWAIVDKEPLCFKYEIANRLYDISYIRKGICNAYAIPSGKRLDKKLIDKLHYSRCKIINDLKTINNYENELIRFGFDLKQ